MVWLIVGLGNPGEEYSESRHNVGFWFVKQLAKNLDCSFQREKKFSGWLSRTKINGEDVLLLMPSTYMNNSGRSVAALCRFYKIEPEFVSHDDLDLPVGNVRLKKGGGSGGHNGLKSIISEMSSQFSRLRFGINHPGHPRDVSEWVLAKPPIADCKLIDAAIEKSVCMLPSIIDGEWQSVIQELHTFKL